MGTHPIFESDFDCLTEYLFNVVGEFIVAVCQRDRDRIDLDQNRRQQNTRWKRNSRLSGALTNSSVDGELSTCGSFSLKDINAVNKEQNLTQSIDALIMEFKELTLNDKEEWQTS